MNKKFIVFLNRFDGAFENFALQAIMFAPKLIHVYPISRFYEELKQNFKYLSGAGETYYIELHYLIVINEWVPYLSYLEANVLII